MSIDGVSGDDDALTSTVRRNDRERFWTIHDKDGYICPDCGRPRGEIRRWEVHHIGREPGNVVGLCLTCHKVRHGADRKAVDLDYWKESFRSLGERA